MKINDIISLRKKKLDSLSNLRINAAKKRTHVKCAGCGEIIAKEIVLDNYKICPFCSHYFQMTAKQRINLIADAGSFRELNRNMNTKNPLDFPGYAEKLDILKDKTGIEEAVVTGTALIDGKKAAIGVLDSRFLMGSMGTVVGEKIVKLTEYALKKKYPLIIVSASGGARMQEGLFSLMQMAKTSAAVEKYKEAGGFFISCLTNPTTGGVSASYASLGDIIMAEPDSLICFAGPRVIEQTIGEKLPEGFQKSEFLLEHGMIDMIVERKHMKEMVSRLIRFHSNLMSN